MFDNYTLIPIKWFLLRFISLQDDVVYSKPLNKIKDVNFCCRGCWFRVTKRYDASSLVSTSACDKITTVKITYIQDIRNHSNCEVSSHYDSNFFCLPPFICI